MKPFRVVTGTFWWYYYLCSFFGGLKYKKDFDQISQFILFIGYPRSGHSLIGSLLDAHPEVIISNQLNALYFFKNKYSREQIFYLIRKNAFDQGKKGRSNSGYKYEVPGQWQGRYQQLKVIGDKRGGRTTDILDHDRNLSILGRLKKKSKAKLKMIHVIRNPYDNISTMVLRQVKRNKRPLTEALFDEKIALYFQKVKTNARLKAELSDIICDVHLENLISRPTEELQRICRFLEIDTTPEYINDCAGIIWKQPNPSRFKLSLWNERRVAQIAHKVNQYDFIQHYNYKKTI